MVGGRECSLAGVPSGTDLGTIFRDLGGTFLQREVSDHEQRKVFRRVAECRTAAMGGTLWQCQACSRWVEVYHSCRDRHCPNCQSLKRYRWVRDRLQELLPVPYFHVVFTLPHRLNPLIKTNPRSCLSLLFQSASRTLQSFATDPKYLGAEPGILMVLHTWGRKLNYHIHVHCIVTGGGLSKDRRRWINAPNPDWLFPVRALSSVFRGKYLTGLDQLRAKGSLNFTGISGPLIHERAWCRLKKSLAKQPFLVYAKRPFGDAARVVKYLGCYTHRVAISNRRIQAYQPGKVTLTFKDYKQHGRIRRQVLRPEEFARAFLQHVLPPRFMRIRSYGLLANTKKRTCLEACRFLLGEVDLEEHNLKELMDENDTDEEMSPDRRACPHCSEPALVPKIIITPSRRDRTRSLLWDSS